LGEVIYLDKSKFGSDQRMMGLPATWESLLEENSIRVEEFEDGDTYVVRAEIPGIDPDHSKKDKIKRSAQLKTMKVPITKK